jgi:hypothetical protein
MTQHFEKNRTKNQRWSRRQGAGRETPQLEPMMPKRKTQPPHPVGRRSQRPPARALARTPATQRPSALKPQQPPPEPRITYSDDLAAKLCEHVADGLSLKEACEISGMPSRTTAYKWLAEHTFFANTYARARRAGRSGRRRDHYNCGHREMSTQGAQPDRCPKMVGRSRQPAAVRRPPHHREHQSQRQLRDLRQAHDKRGVGGGLLRH